MLAFLHIKSMKVAHTQDFSRLEVGDTVVVDTISMLADHKYCLWTSFIADTHDMYRFETSYGLDSNDIPRRLQFVRSCRGLTLLKIPLTLYLSTLGHGIHYR